MQAKKETCPHCGRLVELDTTPGKRGMLSAHIADPLSVVCRGSGGISLELERAMRTKGRSLYRAAVRADLEARAGARKRRFGASQ